MNLEIITPTMERLRVRVHQYKFVVPEKSATAMTITPKDYEYFTRELKRVGISYIPLRPSKNHPCDRVMLFMVDGLKVEPKLRKVTLIYEKE
jgi:hypothetical protein